MVSLENFAEFGEQTEINSPRSLEACKREGIDPRSLLKKTAADFRRDGSSKRIAEMRWEFHEGQRQGKD